MKPQEAIDALKSMQSQIIHGTKVFGEIAELIERLNEPKCSKPDMFMDKTAEDAANELVRLRAEVETLAAQRLLTIRHLNRLATWAQQDPTGPLPSYYGMRVQAWVLNEIKQALGGDSEPVEFEPECFDAEKPN